MASQFAELLRNSDETSGVCINEFMHEVIRLQRSSDMKGIQDLFEAYKHVLINAKNQGTDEERIGLALRNLDYICVIADEYIESQDETISVIKTALCQVNLRIGQVRRFYRDAVSYIPQNNN